MSEADDLRAEAIASYRWKLLRDQALLNFGAWGLPDSEMVSVLTAPRDYVSESQQADIDHRVPELLADRPTTEVIIGSLSAIRDQREGAES